MKNVTRHASAVPVSAVCWGVPARLQAALAEGVLASGASWLDGGFSSGHTARCQGRMWKPVGAIGTGIATGG
jgi:hypothetical protein